MVDHAAVKTKHSLLREYPSAFVLFSLLIGIAFSSYLLLLDEGVSRILKNWIQFPGTLFTRVSLALGQILIYVTLALSVATLVQTSQAAVVARRAALFFTLTAILASLQGLMWGLIFRPIYREEMASILTSENAGEFESSLILDGTMAIVGLECGNGKYLQSDPKLNWTMTCTGTNPMDMNTHIAVVDINGVLTPAFDNLSGSVLFSSTAGAIRNTLLGFFPYQFTWAFTSGSIVGIISVGILTGITMVKSGQTKWNSTASKRCDTGKNHMMELVQGIARIIFHLTHAVVRLAPFFIALIICGAAFDNEALIRKGFARSLTRLSLLLLANFSVAAAGHILVVYPVLMYLTTGDFSYGFLRSLLPAQLYAFCTASSLMTLPMTLQAVESNENIPRSIGHTVVAVGSTTHMDGFVMYMPICLVFLAETVNVYDKVFVSSYSHILILVLTFIASISSAPTPNAGLLMLISIWRTVTPDMPVPDTFIIIYGIEFIADRVQTMVNITGDAVVASIVAGIAKKEKFLKN